MAATIGAELTTIFCVTTILDDSIDTGSEYQPVIVYREKPGHCYYYPDKKTADLAVKLLTSMKHSYCVGMTQAQFNELKSVFTEFRNEGIIARIEYKTIDVLKYRGIFYVPFNTFGQETLRSFDQRRNDEIQRRQAEIQKLIDQADQFAFDDLVSDDPVERPEHQL